jgi:hypothetical protein
VNCNDPTKLDDPSHHRQRGDGSDPVGVSSRTKLRHGAMASSPTLL